MRDGLVALVRTADIVRVSPCDVITSAGLAPGVAIVMRSGCIVLVQHSALRLALDRVPEPRSVVSVDVTARQIPPPVEG